MTARRTAREGKIEIMIGLHMRSQVESGKVKAVVPAFADQNLAYKIKKDSLRRKLDRKPGFTNQNQSAIQKGRMLCP